MKKIAYKILNGFFAVCNFILKYPAIIVFILIVIAIAIAILMFHKNANVGGILGKVFGLLGGKDEIETANSVPADRDVAIGEADANGFTQHKVEELERSQNPFRDKTVVKLPSGKKIKLPKGIKDTDVDRIIETEMEVQIIPKQENYEKARKTADAIKRASSTNKKAKDLVARLKARQ